MLHGAKEFMRGLMIGKLQRWISLFLLTVVGVMGVAIATPAQINGFDFSIEEINSRPSIPTVAIGTLEIAPVFLDGYPVLRVATETLGPNAQRSGEAALRSQQIGQRLQRILESMTDYGQSDLQGVTNLKEKKQQLAEQLVLTSHSVNDSASVIKATFPQDTAPQIMITITAADALYSRSTLDDLANQLSDKIHRVLLEAWEKRQPTVLIEAGLKALLLLGLTIFTSFVFALWQRRLMLQRRRLRSHPGPDLELDYDASETVNALDLLKLQLSRFASQRDYSVNAFLRRSVFWGQIMLWVISIGLLSRSFYFTRPFANWLLGVWPKEWLLSLGRSGVLGTPLFLLLIFLAVSLLDRFIDLIIDRLARQWLEAQTETIQASHRFSLRVPTLVSAAKGVSTVIAYALFILIALQQFRAISTPIATFLGIITFAISLGAQNFIKDVINGVLLLLEDQYAVGDVIAINNQVDGLVEYVNLRITQLRNLDGELITIPNGTISIVRNMTSSWSQAKLAVTVSHDTAVDHAITVMEQVAQELYTDPEWQTQVMEQPVMLGVDKLDADGCQILMLLKTQPMRHWDVAREYRRRLKSAFEREAIALGMPRQRIFVDSSPRDAHRHDAIRIGEVRSPHITQNSHP